MAADEQRLDEWPDLGYVFRQNELMRILPKFKLEHVKITLPMEETMSI